MGRKAKDKELTDLAHAADQLLFPAPETFRHLIPRHYFKMPNGTFAVRVKIGKQTVAVGYVKDSTQAARVADAALLYFSPWRSKGPNVPSSTSFNFSIRQAQSDSNTATTFLWLQKWEAALVMRGLIPARADIPARVKPEKLSGPSAMDHVLAELKSLREQLNRIEKAHSFPAPREYIIPQRSQPPEIIPTPAPSWSLPPVTCNDLFNPPK